MKKFATILLTVLGTSAAFAHEMEGGSTAGLFGLKAEYLHVLLNPLPVYGLAMGVLVLAAGLLAQSRAARNIGLLVIILCAASAWPVLYFGQHGYNHLYPQLDTESQEWLKIHMDRAERFIYAFYLTALLGIGALLSQKKFLKTNKGLAVLTLLAAIIALGIGGWISRAGGQVSHSEFRNDPSTGLSNAQINLAAQEDKDQQENKEGKVQIPDTREGILKAIQEHHQELAATVKAKKLGEVHEQAFALRDLAKALPAKVNPVHKKAVENAVKRISQLAEDLDKSGDAGDQVQTEANLKKMDATLEALEKHASM